MIERKKASGTNQPPKVNKRLLNMLQSKHAATRQKAVEKLASIDYSEEVFQLLLTALDDVDSKVVSSAINALGYFGDVRALDKLLSLFEVTEQVEEFRSSYDGQKRHTEFVFVERRKVSPYPLIEALGRIGDPRALPWLTVE